MQVSKVSDRGTTYVPVLLPQWVELDDSSHTHWQTVGSDRPEFGSPVGLMHSAQHSVTASVYTPDDCCDCQSFCP